MLAWRRMIQSAGGLPMRADINYSSIIDSDEAREAQAAADAAPNLPSAQIDPERFYITQHYDRYTDENHEVWRTMYAKRMETLYQQASNVFLTGMEAIGLPSDRVPKVDEIN